jgi:hypothetical protein
MPARTHPSRNAVAALIGRGVYWLPVLVPLLLLCMVAVRGLRPALAERARLEFEAARVAERYEQSEASFRYMQAVSQAWEDPVFRERIRRRQSTTGR